MKQKFEFRAITYHCEVVNIIEEFDLPDFKVGAPMKIGKLVLPGETIQSQQMSWLDNMDKREFMIKHELSAIIDYKVAEVDQPTILSIIKDAKLDEQITLDLLAIYSEIKPIIDKQPLESQITTLFSHYSVSQKSVLSAYKHILTIFELGLRTKPKQLTGKVKQLKKINLVY
jgi:hypothetical protein